MSRLADWAFTPAHLLPASTLHACFTPARLLQRFLSTRIAKSEIILTREGQFLYMYILFITFQTVARMVRSSWCWASDTGATLMEDCNKRQVLRREILGQKGRPGRCDG
jgi:hypothetical protein